MPWDAGQKKFIRENGRYVGAVVWADDAAAAQVIDSLGHDTHDQDIADGITETVNINGINAMLAEFDAGGFKIIDLADGTAPQDACTFGQYTTTNDQVITNTAAIAALDVRVTQNETDISTNQFDIAGLQGAEITAQSWDGQNFTSVKTSGNLVTDLTQFDYIDLSGPTYMASATTGLATAPINVATHQSHYVEASGGVLTLDFINEPSANHPVLGQKWEARGAVIIEGTYSNVVITGITANTIGTPITGSNVSSVLTYYLVWDGGSITPQKFNLVWN